MAKKKQTIFQALDKAISGNWDDQSAVSRHINSYDMTGSGGDVIYRTDNLEDYEAKKLELQQNKYLSDRWVKANVSMSVQAFTGLNNVKLMYRDADLMDSFPEVGAALDTLAEEACIPNAQGKVVNVYSKSDRVRSILDDLFTNRLNLQLTAPMVVRATAKYGNQFMLLDVDSKNGVRGWKQMPVFDVERVENGIHNPYGMGTTISVNSTVGGDDADLSTQFIWNNENNAQVPFRDWQVAHFRLLTNSLYLPYGVSYLNAARRHWRMLSLMEDMMLIYRLERSMERRVYKIFVGAIDEADVKAYVEQIANEFKRTPIVDPLTGQVDLRKNILPVHKDTPIPLLDGRTISIENLAREFEDGKENFVYSIQDKTHRVVPGKVVWCGKNYTADKLYKITLDEDSHMILAGEHEIIMRDGTKKRADEVSAGESVMPLYEEVTTSAVRESIIENGFADFKEYHSPTKKSHKITNVEIVGGEDVYCMTVVGSNGEEDRHNFALTTWKPDGSLNDSGVFVSNCTDQDIFIPVRDQNAPTPIDTLSAGQNITALDDIKFVQNKLFTALRIPKTFLNFEETAGEGKNLALMDVRFTRVINRIQQAFLMELTKVASIHLYLLGFADELNNFTLSMNNPSTQAEGLEIENLQNKINAVRDAVSDPGTGLPIMSTARALKDIMKWSEKDIKTNFEEIRLEKGIVAELEKTTQIIKKTGIFDTVDKIYGEPGAKYMDEQPQQDAGGMDLGGGGGAPPMPSGGGMDAGAELDNIGAPGEPETGDISGQDGMMPTSDLNGSGMGEQPNESTERGGRLITETRNVFDEYVKSLDFGESDINETVVGRADIYDKDSLIINEEFDAMIRKLEEFVVDEGEEE